MKKNLKKIISIMILSVVLLGVCNVNVAKAESSITFTPVTSIKLGEELQGKFQYQNASAGMEVNIGVSAEDGQKFWSVGSGGPIPESPVNGTIDMAWSQDGGETGTTATSVAINVGEITAKCYTSYDDCWAHKEPIASYKVKIEEPVINDNIDDICYVGDKVDFTTTLTNTVLKEGKVDELKTSASVGDTFTYQAKTEIVEGMDLVVSENVDYSNALKSQEKLTFKGTGTVKIKVTYEPVILWGNYINGQWIDENEKDLMEATYKPETILTIKVVEAKEALNEEVTNVKSEKLVEEKYTAETWKAFSVALAKAESVLAKENVTNEEYASAIEELKVAKDNLKAKEDNSSSTNNSNTNSSTNNSAANGSVTNNSTQSTSKEEISEAPKTGDTVNVLFYAILCVASLVCMVCMKKKAR